MYVLKFIKQDEFPIFLDKKAISVIEYLLKKVLFSQPELLEGQKPSNIQMTKEFLEQWIVQGMNLESIGAGNFPIDVYSPNDYGVDVKFVSAKVDENGQFKKDISNETSLAQNFANEGNDLDTLFSEERYDDVLTRWKALLTNKFQKAKNGLSLKRIYYFVFIRGGNSISLAICEVNTDLLNTMEVVRGNDKSVFIKNYIEDRYGEVKVYKSKKRMELRFFPKNMYEDKLLHKWDFNDIFQHKHQNLRDIIDDETAFDEYIKNEFKRIFLNK